jgi:hypothetical protein
MFSKNLYHGRGIIYYPSGSVYMGYHYNMRRHGFGLFVKSNGDKELIKYEMNVEMAISTGHFFLLTILTFWIVL